MEYRSISIGERVFHALMEIKRPTEDVSELIDRLIDQDAKHSVSARKYHNRVLKQKRFVATQGEPSTNDHVQRHTLIYGDI